MLNKIIKFLCIKKYFLLLFFFFIVLTFQRFHGINRYPYGIEGDEYSWSVTSGLRMYNIKSSERGLWSMHDASAENFPASIWLNQIGIKLLGYDVLTARYVVAFINIVSCFFFFLILKRFFSSATSLIVLALYSFSSLSLISSRVALQGVYINFFFFIALFFILLSSERRPRKSIRNFFIFISSITTVMALLTYNLSYFIPVVLLTYILIEGIRAKDRKKELIFKIAIYLIPITVSAFHWVRVLIFEMSARNYVLEATAFTRNPIGFNAEVFIDNVINFLQVLFIGNDYSSRDMLVNQPYTIVNLLVVFFATIGLLFSFRKIKKSYIFLIWLSLFSIVYFFLMGLFIPRAWLSISPVIYIYVGYLLDYLLIYIEKRKIYFKFLLYGSITVLFLCISFSDFVIFYSHLLKNTSFLSTLRQTSDVVKTYGSYVENGDVIYILKEDEQTVINSQLLLSAVSYYSLRSADREKAVLNARNIEDSRIFTSDNLSSNFMLDNKVRKVISQNIAKEDVKTYLNQRNILFSERVINDNYILFNLN